VEKNCFGSWIDFQNRVKGRPLDNFAKDFGVHFDFSNWFNPARMAAGPSTPPRLHCFSDLTSGTSAFTIPWSLQKPIFEPGNEILCSENPNPSPLQTSVLFPDASAMAYFRADPAPFIPGGLHQVEVQQRKPMERMVLMKPRTKFQDMAIVSIDPMPEHQVTFQAIREVVTDFLTNGQHVAFTDMQPTHLGQAFVKFRNAYDRDRLIQESPYQFGEVSISFVEHNKGRNWRAVNFNRECWLLLLGYPPDHREDEFVVNTISSFGRVMYWVDDRRHLSRVLVKARVIDYETIPHFLVLTEGEGFQGESWTVQVEVLQGQLLGGLPQDEDPAPGPGDFPLGGPFDLFGFGQNAPGPAVQPNQQNGLNLGGLGGGIAGHGFVVQDNELADAQWNEDIIIPDFNLNEEPENPPAIDLNAPADMQEMVVDPVFHGPQPQEMF
jgi:hypothetical protein